MQLDPNSQELLEAIKKLGLRPIYELPVEEARARMRASFTTHAPEVPCHVEEDVFHIEGYPVRLRIYNKTPGKTAQPCLLFFHGGGWTLNDLDTHDNLCRTITDKTACTVVSVDYRRAPEFTYPVAVDDSYAALVHISEHHQRYGIDQHRIAVGGDSSGGYQAILVAIRARDLQGPKIKFQWIAYPVADHYSLRRASYEECGETYSLTQKQMIWFWDNFLPLGMGPANDDYAFPLQISDLSNLPPLYIMISHFDPLRDEGLALVEKLRDAGNEVECTKLNQMHGFLMQRAKIPAAQRAFEQSLNPLAKALEII